MPRKIEHNFDFCVVGGGIAGVCAAIAAARGGAKVAIVQDRPVFGGNSSSEIRMHITGADVHNTYPGLRETGILEELRLENLYRNPQRSYSVWDTVLYEKVIREPNITPFLNCSVLDAATDHNNILSITGWQLTTYTLHTIKAKIFADCSGDGILAALTGALYRIGREAREEYGESIEPETADTKTMGMTCMFQARDMGTPQPFKPLPWANVYANEDDLPDRWHGWPEMGYWWIELGGEQDSIHDTEQIRDELLKIVYGLWDHMKNYGDHGAENWALDWIQFLPGKRESVRYVSDHVTTQNDLEAEGRFPDRVAYGGWSMDDHNPGGFNYKSEPTIFHPCPRPYGITYRSLYSRNIDNLMFAGRCAGFSHAAMSSTRVMGTCAVMGQAVGSAAAIAVSRDINPRQVGEQYIDDLQQRLLGDDAYIPWLPQKFGNLVNSGRLLSSSGNPEPLRDGVNRPVGDNLHRFTCRIGDSVWYEWDSPKYVRNISLVVDSNINANLQMSHLQPDDQLTSTPEEILKDFKIKIQQQGIWHELKTVEENYQRLIKIDINCEVTGIGITPLATWGSDTVTLYAFYPE